MITKSDLPILFSVIALAVVSVIGMFVIANVESKTEYYNIGNGIQATSDIEHGVVCYKTFLSVSCVKVLEGERE